MYFAEVPMKSAEVFYVSLMTVKMALASSLLSILPTKSPETSDNSSAEKKFAAPDKFFVIILK